MLTNLFDHVVILGAGGGIGSALATWHKERGSNDQKLSLFSRKTGFDITSDHTVSQMAKHIGPPHPASLIINATGFLHNDEFQPEKSLRQLEKDALIHAFLINAVGPGLLMKHVARVMPRQHAWTFVTLSARVGSISDNELGGWYSYRTSKAAHNQLLKTASIEIRRTHPNAILVAMHPGTVATKLSEPFSKTGLDVRQPSKAADDIMKVITNLKTTDHGTFIDHKGMPIAW